MTVFHTQSGNAVSLFPSLYLSWNWQQRQSPSWGLITKYRARRWIPGMKELYFLLIYIKKSIYIFISVPYPVDEVCKNNKKKSYHLRKGAKFKNGMKFHLWISRGFCCTPYPFFQVLSKIVMIFWNDLGSRVSKRILASGQKCLIRLHIFSFFTVSEKKKCYNIKKSFKRCHLQRVNL